MKTINLEDLIQISVGSAILALPVAFTEEAWKMSSTLPTINILLIFVTSLVLNACFIYYGVYEGNITNKKSTYIARIFINYIVTLLTVSYILFLLNIVPDSYWLPRIILIAFPASLSGAVIDSFDKE